MHLLISNDCVYLTKAQIKYLVKWYVAPPHRKISSVTFLCPHLDPETNLGKNQTKYIDSAMKTVSANIEYKIVTDYNLLLRDGYLPDYVMYAHFGPSYLEDAFEDNPMPIGRIVYNYLQFEAGQPNAKRIFSNTYPQSRSETMEAIEFLGDRFLRYSDAYKAGTKR